MSSRRQWIIESCGQIQAVAMSENVLDFEILNLCASYPSKTPAHQTGFHSTPGRFLDIEEVPNDPNNEGATPPNKSSPPFRRGSSQGVANPSVIPLDEGTRNAVRAIIANDLKRHRYEIDFKNLIAHGQYGSVYKVTKAGPEKRVMAAKVISMMLRCVEKNCRVENGPLVRSFRRERYILSLIGTHPNLVAFEEGFAERNEVTPASSPPGDEQKSKQSNKIKVPNYYFIMEYANRGTLEQLVTRNQRGYLTEPEVKFLALDLIRGVAHLHTLGVFHLDIKPENMLLFEGGFGPLNLTLKLTDFGLAQTAPTMLDAIGTYMTMAPELVRNRWLYLHNLSEFERPYDSARADAYSVGATIYFALHARYPCDNFEYSQLTTVFRDYGLHARDYLFYLGRLSELMGKPRDKLTQQCVKLLNSLLEVDPAQRALITDNLLNDWFNIQANPSFLTAFFQLCRRFR